MPETACARTAASLAELALGVADARERADAIAHLECCPHCRRDLAELSEVADALWLLAPPVATPPGFAERVAARALGHSGAALTGERSLASTGTSSAGAAGGPAGAADAAGVPAGGAAGGPAGAADAAGVPAGGAAGVPAGAFTTARSPHASGRGAGRHRARPGRRVLIGAACLLVAALAGIGGWLAGSSGSARPPGSGPAAASGDRHLVSAELRGGGRVLGQVVLSAGRPPWISMAFHDPGASGYVRCELRDKGGTPLLVGSMWLSRGDGWWAGAVHTPGVIVTGVLVAGTSGQVLAQASFAPFRL